MGLPVAGIAGLLQLMAKKQETQIKTKKILFIILLSDNRSKKGINISDFVRCFY